MLIQMKLAVAERQRSVCTGDTPFYWLLTFLQCNYHRDLRQLWQRVCWPLCSCGSSIYLSHTTAALYRTSWCKQRSRRRRKSAFTSHSIFTNRTQTLSLESLNLALQVTLSPATGTSLSASGGNFITQVNLSSAHILFVFARRRRPRLTHFQVMRVSNTIVDQKPLAMRMKISYTAAGGPITKTHDVTNFPPGI